MSVIELSIPKPWSKVEPYIPAGFSLNDEGVFLDGKKDIKISDPCWVSTLTRSSKGDNWGYVINWIDQDGNHQHKAFPAQRVTLRGAPIADDLQALGLQVIPGEQRHLMRYLGSFKLPKNFRLTSVTKLGWVDGIDDDLVYVLPHQVISISKAHEIIFQPEVHSLIDRTLHSRGSLEHWKKFVAEPCIGHAIPIFTLCFGLSAPLLKFAGLDSCGFHLYGASSTGKTTILQITASMWGNGMDSAVSSDSHINRWNTTGNALEATAASHNDGLLTLDEMGTCEAKNFGKVIYDLLGGRGKSRLDKNSQMQALREWRTTPLSTGEISVYQKILNDTGKAPHTGQLIRMIDIPIHDGIFASINGINKAELANCLKQACSCYYGTAAPAFISRLITLEVDSLALQRHIKDSIIESEEFFMGNSQLESYQLRVLRWFAIILVTGCLAADFEILPFTHTDIALAVQEIWHRWLGDFDNQSDSVQGMRNLKYFIQRYQQSRFRNAHDENNGGNIIRDLAGYFDRERNLYLFTEEGFREACAGHDWRGTLRELGARGFLFKNDARKKMKSKHTIDGVSARISLYAIRSSLLEEDI